MWRQGAGSVRGWWDGNGNVRARCEVGGMGMEENVCGLASRRSYDEGLLLGEQALGAAGAVLECLPSPDHL